MSETKSIRAYTASLLPPVSKEATNDVPVQSPVVARGFEAANGISTASARASRELIMADTIASSVSPGALDPARLVEHIIAGTMEFTVPLQAGAKLGPVVVPKDVDARLVLDVADGKVGFARSGLQFCDAQGKGIKLDGPGAAEASDVSIDERGRVHAKLLMSSHDVTGALFGAAQIPSDPRTLATLMMGRTPHKPHSRPVLVQSDATRYAAQVRLKSGALPLVGDSRLVVADDESHARLAGDGKSALLEVTGKVGIELRAGSGALTSLPSEVNVRVVLGLVDQRCCYTFGHSVLSDVKLDLPRDSGRVRLAVDELTIDGRQLPQGGEAFDGLRMDVDRVGKLDVSLLQLLGPDLLRKVDSGDGVVHLPELKVSADRHQVGTLALNSPMVLAAMKDPVVLRAALQAQRAVASLVEGFTMTRSLDASISKAGEAKLAAAKAELATLFVAVGGMEPNGKAEAMMSRAFDGLIEAGKVSL